MIDPAVERLEAERRKLDTLGIPLRRVALGHATVDLDAAEAAIRSRLGPGDVASAADDVQLGARSRIVVSGDGQTIVLLEPYTEGRLAASLARFGQGPVVEYLEAAGDGPDLASAAASAGIALSVTSSGPFGPQRLVVGGKPWGPHLVLVDRPRAATIRS